MEIQFSNHAEAQLEIRSSITKVMVIDAIHHPDNILTSFRNRKLYQKEHHDAMLEIVAIQEDNKLIVITEYLLDKP